MLTPPQTAVPAPAVDFSRTVEHALPVVHVLGFAVMLLAAAMAIPVSVALWHGGPTLPAFGESFLATLAGGLIMWAATRRHRRELQVRDGFLLVTLVWSVLPAFAALPLMLFMPALSFTDAYFECISGITTTGATVLSDLDKLPPSINVWRCLLQWFGGVGIIVMAVAVLQVHLGAGFFWTSGGFEYPLLWGVVALAFAIRGGGRYSVDALIGREI